MAAEGKGLCAQVGNAEKMYSAERNTYVTVANGSTGNAFIKVSAGSNKYFTAYQVASAPGAGNTIATTFVVTTIGTGDAAGITVTYDQRPSVSAVISASP